MMPQAARGILRYGFGGCVHEAAGAEPSSEDEIAAEVKAARAERRAREAAQGAG